MKKTAKAAKTILDSNKLEKKTGIYLGDYFCMKERQPRPVTLGFLQMLADKLIQWARLPDSLHMGGFLELVALNDKDYRRWRGRSEELEQADEYAKYMIGMRREVGAITRKYDGNMIKYSLWQYAPEYKECAEFHSKLARKEAEAMGGNAQFIINVPKIESEPDEYFKDKK